MKDGWIYQQETDPKHIPMATKGWLHKKQGSEVVQSVSGPQFNKENLWRDFILDPKIYMEE